MSSPPPLALDDSIPPQLNCQQISTCVCVLFAKKPHHDVNLVLVEHITNYDVRFLGYFSTVWMWNVLGSLRPPENPHVVTQHTTHQHHKVALHGRLVNPRCVGGHGL